MRRRPVTHLTVTQSDMRGLLFVNRYGDPPSTLTRSHMNPNRSTQAADHFHGPKTALVTGGTDGIGKAIAQALAATGHRTIIVGRDDHKGRMAELDSRRTTSNQQVEFIRADLSLIRNVDILAATITERYKTLDTLVLNAGVVHGTRQLTSEGLERMFATNFLGRFELTRALLPHIEAAGRRDDPAHLLFVNGAARRGRIDYGDPTLRSRFSLIRAVQQFCLANDLFAVSLAHHLYDSSANGRVAVACIKLGVVKTNIRQHFPGWMKRIVPLIMDPLFGQSPGDAAMSAMRAIRESSPNDPTSTLFMKIRRFRHILPDDHLLDRDEWKRFWIWADQLAKSARAASHISARDTERSLSGLATT
jgi:NAD(P)-dependent dehydrogenase (short-subunit alcohol dehydrogenase family)